MAYGYRCPRCRTKNTLHEGDCRYRSLKDGVIEEAHIDIISSLSLTRLTEDELASETANGWSQVHDDVLGLYQKEGRITTQQRETDEDDDEVETVLYLRTAQEYRDQLVPTEAHIKTVWEHGPIDGCKDNALTAVISWHEWREFSWEATRERVVDWLRDTRAWERGSWEESSPEEVVDSKKHVHEESYGWKEKAISAKRVIESAQGVSA